MTPLHARPKAYRNLHNAKRVSNRGGKSENTLEREYNKETAKMIAEGHKAFWKKRGISKPPYVSGRHVGVFETL